MRIHHLLSASGESQDIDPQGPVFAEPLLKVQHLIFFLRSSPGTNNRGRCVIRHPCLSHVRRRAPSQSSTRADSPRHECFHHFAQEDFPSKLQAQIITGRWHCRLIYLYSLRTYKHVLLFIQVVCHFSCYMNLRINNQVALHIWILMIQLEGDTLS